MNPAKIDSDRNSWPVLSFAVNHAIVSSPAMLALDRTHSEFALVTPLTSGFTTIEEWADDDGPIFFEAATVHSAGFQHGEDRKVAILTPDWQVDLVFTSANLAHNFMDALELHARAQGNNGFMISNIPSDIAFAEPDFDLASYGNVATVYRKLRVLSTSEASDWSQLYKSGQFSDFTISAGEKQFLVHRSRICLRSEYFNKACTGRFAEAEDRAIKLPEEAHIVAMLLEELYGVANETTGPLFMGFALQSDEEKENALTDLLELFIAADKYNLEAFRCKVADMIVDRLPFVQDALTIVYLAVEVHDDGVPEQDCGLREAMIEQIKSRHATILEDDRAWNVFSRNRVLLKAFHRRFYYDDETEGSETGLPPAKKRKLN
ncbi:hypothetical protein IQ07DRAFT_232852 [Pyrenochaeta sp. DS3sAY3a]|nr:hypothetical protein IQ07DRAFT_232852 [Pyrenochaeta sp. DS3sAY3a]